MAKRKDEPLLVTTSQQGVFFGYGQMSDKVTITLKQARMCVFFSADTKGSLGLAAVGPSKTCRIGPAVPEITLIGVTAVCTMTDRAVKAWESGPWG